MEIAVDKLQLLPSSEMQSETGLAKMKQALFEESQFPVDTQLHETTTDE